MIGVGGVGAREHCTDLRSRVAGLGHSNWDTWAAVLTRTGGGRVWDETYLRIEKGVGLSPSVHQVGSCIYRESFFIVSCRNLLSHFNLFNMRTNLYVT